MTPDKYAPDKQDSQTQKAQGNQDKSDRSGLQQGKRDSKKKTKNRQKNNGLRLGRTETTR